MQQLERWGPIGISVMALALVLVFGRLNLNERAAADEEHAFHLGKAHGRIEELSARMANLERELGATRAYLFKLYDLMKSGGINPPPLPGDHDERGSLHEDHHQRSAASNR